MSRHVFYFSVFAGVFESFMLGERGYLHAQLVHPALNVFFNLLIML